MFKQNIKFFSCTSLGITSKIFDAAKKISGEGFRFSKASADTIASNLIKEDTGIAGVEINDPSEMNIIKILHNFRSTMARSAYNDSGKLAAARFALTLIRSALEATATLRPLLLHCFTSELVNIKE